MKKNDYDGSADAAASGGASGGISRRRFLALLGTVAAGGTTLAAVRAETTAPQAGRPAVGGTSTKRSTRQWVMVIDLRKCEGCTSLGQPPQCTEACIKEHFVPKGQQWIQVYRQELPGEGSYFMRAPCNQCENAPCANVCPVAATYHSDEGIVLIDHNRCIGCRLCMAACPYQRRFFNWGDPELPPEAAFATYSPEYPVPAKRGTVIKCMFCAHRLANGKLPACVDGCPMKALYIGDLTEDLASNGVDVLKLSEMLADNNAYRFKEELGTQPRVYYLPGHGQAFNRHAQDPKKQELKPVTWDYGLSDHSEK